MRSVQASARKLLPQMTAAVMAENSIRSIQRSRNLISHFFRDARLQIGREVVRDETPMNTTDATSPNRYRPTAARLFVPATFPYRFRDKEKCATHSNASQIFCRQARGRLRTPPAGFGESPRANRSKPDRLGCCRDLRHKQIRSPPRAPCNGRGRHEEAHTRGGRRGDVALKTTSAQIGKAGQRH